MSTATPAAMARRHARSPASPGSDIGGVANHLDVLDAERNLFTAEQALIALQRAELDNLVSLYVALGGGAIERSGELSPNQR